MVFEVILQVRKEFQGGGVSSHSEVLKIATNRKKKQNKQV